MKYKFAVDKEDYTDFASGRVLYSAPGTTGFPVRLTSEILQRAFAILGTGGHNGPYTIYDPCCGGAFLLTTIGFLFPERIAQLIATDFDSNVLEIAVKNLSLLSPEGLAKRREELAGLAAAYGKDSHKEALDSLERLRRRLGARRIGFLCQQRDITDIKSSPVQGVDIIVTDIPYGQLVSWGGSGEDPLDTLFVNCRQALSSAGVLVIVADKRPRLQHQAFQRREFLKLGKRQIAFFQPVHG